MLISKVLNDATPAQKQLSVKIYITFFLNVNIFFRHNIDNFQKMILYRCITSIILLGMKNVSN